MEDISKITEKSPENTKYLIKVPSLNNFLTIYSSWISDQIEIKILNNLNNCQFSGVLMIEDIKSSAKDLEIPFDQFYNECRDALITTGGLENFTYSIDNNKFIIQKNDIFKITYLEISIIETTENLKDLFITESIEIINSIRKNLLKLQRKCDKDNNDYKELEISCKEIIEEKDCLEKKLLSKFIILLNSKKDKIAQLQTEVKKNKLRPSISKDDTDAGEDDNQNDSDESEDPFSLPTQKMMPLDSSQLTQTQLKFINLPKRKNIADKDKPSTSKDIGLPRRYDIPGCSSKYPSTVTSDLNEINKNNNDESQELFQDM